MILDDLLGASRAGRIELDPFHYSAIFPIATFVGGAVVPVNIPINADSDFLIRYTNLAAYSANNTFVANPDFLITLFDTGSGRNLQDQVQHVGNVTGVGQRPYIWPEPKLVKASSVIIVTLTNQTAATAYRVDVTLAGFKVFQLKEYRR